MADREYLSRLHRQLVDEGKLIEAGWIGLRIAAVAPDAPPLQLEEMRQSFFAGAHHLFASMMTIMEPGAEPTDNDMKRMSLIHDELELFIVDFEKRNGLRPKRDH